MSKLLQSKAYDLAAATKHLGKPKEFLEKLRSDEGFEKQLVDAREITEDLGIPATFESESMPKRLKKKTRQFSYEAEDEPVQDAKQRFKETFYFAILDTGINSVDERFIQLKEIDLQFGILYHIGELKDQSTKFILEKCKTLEESLTHNGLKDIDAVELCRELQAISRHVSEESTPLDVLHFLPKSDLKEIVPNLLVALRILLTLPVSEASGERSFSKLKLIKTYLRSSMTHDRLVGLAIISIEPDLAQNINLSEIVSEFSKKKVRRPKF